MKIGLLTTYSFNYGSYFQAVSLQKELQQTGHECELINEEFKKYKWLNLFLMYMIDPILPFAIKEIIAKKIPQYNSYLKIKTDADKAKCSPKYIHSFRKISKRYDCIIIGSDELWSADKNSIRFVPEHFGYRCQCPIFSYATCAIKFDTANETLSKIARKGLKNLTSISVRDDISKEKIEKILPGKEIEKVLDPTLLNPFFSVNNVQTNTIKFVLLYGQDYDETQRMFIKKYAQQNNLRIHCVGWRQKWCDAFIDTSSGEELQKMFAEAEFCFPSTFHGTIFSIVNHKQFMVMVNPLRGEKIELLLKDLNLESRIFSEGIPIDGIDGIDYEKVEKLLAAYRENSRRYLEQSLERIANSANCL